MPPKEEPAKYKAVCRCGASNTAERESDAVTYIIHNKGCDNNLERWQNWIEVTKVK